MPPYPSDTLYQRVQQDQNRHLQDFHQFLKTSLTPADNPAASHSQSFVPLELIEEYFGADDNRRLSNVLEAVYPDESPLPVETSVVQESYLKVFCILLSIGRAAYICHFVEHDDLSDTRLPFSRDSKPSKFPISTTQPDFWDSFSEKQWTFCAAEMKYMMINHYFEADRILPIVEREVLAQGGSAVVSKIKLHKSFNKLQRDVAQLPNPISYSENIFVLKTYHKDEAETYYYNEVNAFRRLRNGGTSDTHIVTFYGSYMHNGTYNIILEYANQGNLENYFRKVYPPTCGGDIERFWIAICNIFKALACIHEVESNVSTGPQIFQGWHQDVKPKNILVVGNGRASPYDWNFRLADLGLSHFKRNSPESFGLDPTGTETYGAPECFRADRFLEERALNVKQCIDLWSFGCILCEAAVWLVYGFSGLEKFRRRRAQEIQDIPVCKNGDWFHDGEKVLQTVLNTLEDLKLDTRRTDNVTGKIVDNLIKTMLDIPALRTSSLALYIHSGRILDHRTSMISSPASVIPMDPGRPLLPGDSSDPFVESPKASPTDGGLDQPTSTIRPINLPVADLNTQVPIYGADRAEQSAQNNAISYGSGTIDTVPNNISTSGLSSSTRITPTGRRSEVSLGQVPVPKPRSPRPSLSDRATVAKRTVRSAAVELPVLRVNVAEKCIKDKREGKVRKLLDCLPDGNLLNRLKNRDHVFLIDDAGSMKAHQTEVKRILGILAYLVKDSDPDGIELRFTNSDSYVQSKNSTQLVETFLSNTPRGLTDIRLRLGWILNEYSKTLKKQSQGRFWHRFKSVRSLNIYVLTDGIWQPISDVTSPINQLISNLKDNGQYQVGIQFISFGSNEQALERLKYLDKSLDLERDIIDHEPSTGNIWKMLFGATDPWFDDDKKYDQGIDKSLNGQNSPQC
ncbi:hypothetical protein BP5796_04259 [Coleophoma crateriformis]|uniref:Protein kinase domain-containing protein n=1 Tax=Coleophoma crateriformis TaxID=565419 RepID=A0A3D8SIC9_9HELO|nr:hypothetical protein BP5796_04259 [Coleophoma crateriformis]